MRILLALALSAVTAIGLRAQVTVAPTTLFLGDNARFGTFLVRNQSERPQEVSIGFRFGYPVTDSLGQGHMVYGDSLPAASRWSMKEWAHAFPRQFVLPPGQQQIVRLTVRVPADRPAGAYWTRLVTTSTAQSPPADTAAGVGAHITFRLEQVTTVLYRHGEVQAGLVVAPPEARVGDDRVGFLLHVDRSGNAPVYGVVGMRLLDADGKLVGEASQPLTVYFDAVSTFSVARTQLPEGRYVAEFRITGERPDIAPQDRLPFPPVTRRVEFTVPG